MPGLVSAPAKRKRATAKPMRTDDELIAAIADDRDTEAFSEIVSRYQEPALNLALRMTGRHALAQEAVQEGLIRIWKRASRYQQGNARGWILRIVARESLRVSQAEQREGSKRERMDMEKAHVAEPAEKVSEPFEKTEALAALRIFIGDLPLGERHALVLYYGAELSHAEIASELSVSRSLVTHRIKQAITRIRSLLTAGGYAAALPLLEKPGLSEAICEGESVPPGLREQILGRIAEHSRRMVAPVGKSLAAVWTVVVLAAAGAGAWFWFSSPAPAIDTKQPIPATPVQPAQPFEYHWSFLDSPAPKEWVRFGKWEVLRSPRTNKSVMLARYGPNTGIMLPPQLPGRNVLLECKVRVAQKGKYGFGVYLAKPEAMQACSERTRAFDDTVAPGKTFPWMTVRVFVIGDTLLQYLDGKLWSVRRYEVPVEGLQFLISTHNTFVREIRMRTVGSEDFPPENRDPDAAMRKWPRAFQPLKEIQLPPKK